MVMAYYTGQTLHEHIVAASKPVALPIDQCIDIAQKIATALKSELSLAKGFNVHEVLKKANPISYRYN